LHVLGTPPAFVLSQDQTLEEKFALRLASEASCRAHAMFNRGSLLHDSVFKERLSQQRLSQYTTLQSVSQVAIFVSLFITAHRGDDLYISITTRMGSISF
jgi:hypothetical protein